MIDIQTSWALQKKIPQNLNDKIEDMISVLKYFRIADGQLAIFNNHDYIQSKKIDNVIKKGINKNNKMPNFLNEAGYHRVAKNKLYLSWIVGNQTILILMQVRFHLNFHIKKIK